MRSVSALLSLAILIACPAIAGDQVLYNAFPAWVVETRIEPAERTNNSPIVLIDQQARIEDGQLWTYFNTAAALDSPQALTQFGTLSATWLPDKGDLVIHSVELIRDGEVVDLLERGAQFEVIRREKGLESRLLDGALTATMSVPGARIGDIIRFSYSTTLRDQAMGENVQWQSPLIAKPFPLDSGRVSISWPSDIDVSRVRIGEADVAEPDTKDGFYVWSADLPLEERNPIPSDAPGRYQVGELMQVSTYTDWSAVSKGMAVHYDPTGTVVPASDLAARIADITQASDDPLKRAALALQLVQDDISYLLNGLNGGNYLPQSPQETWDNRFGDCKAKSLLLLAILRELGVDSEVVLVRSQGGDALPSLAPMPGNFDHMIVRAVIAGKNYWLDGTTAGSRIDTIDRVPHFYHALPLRKEGAELMSLDVRPPATPDRFVRLTVDQSAGLRLPSLLEIEIEFRGLIGAQWRAVADQADKDTQEAAVYDAVNSIMGDAQLVDQSINYDHETGVARISASGIQSTRWNRDRADYELEPPAQATKNVSFIADRARATWKDIPLALNGPIYFMSELKVILPDERSNFQMDGADEIVEIIGGVELASSASLEGNRFTVSQTMRSIAQELSVEEIPLAKRDLARFDRSLPVLRSASEIRQLWEYFGKDRALLAPLEARYAQAIADADSDDPTALLNRARFRAGVFNHAGALEDMNAANEIEASRENYLFRGVLKRETGDMQGALDDFKLAEDLDPDGSTYTSQIELLALLGRQGEGIDLAEEFTQLVNDPAAEIDIMATALAWSGRVDEGLTMLEDFATRRPGDGDALNAICWYAGIGDRMNAQRLQNCIEAVEKSDYAAAALDSRALANLRLGNLVEAKTDIDAALLAEPSLAPSRLLRGIIRMALGDGNGREEIELALTMQPSLRATYNAWGLDF